MPLAPRHFCAYRLEPWEFTKAALADLVQAKNAVLEKGIANADAAYRGVDALAAVAGRGGDDLLSRIDRETVRFLDTGLAWAWLRTPEDRELGNDLIVETLLLLAATEGEKNEGELPRPYTLEEVAEIADGAAGYYHDMTFLRTLRHALREDADDGYGTLLYATLPPIEDGEDVRAMYGWDDALIFSLLLQTVWKSFPFLHPDEQRRLLREYFYMAIVAGVPVRARMEEVLSTKVPGVDYAGLARGYAQAIGESRERMPADTDDEGGVRFAEVQKEFFAKAYEETIETLALQKYVDALYRTQPESQYFGLWLREGLQIAMMLKKWRL